MLIILGFSTLACGLVLGANYTLRGHSSIEASLDLALHVQRIENPTRVLVTPTKMRGTLVSKFSAIFGFEHKLESTELASAQFYGTEVFISSSDQEIDEAIVESLADGTERNKAQLATAVSGITGDGVNKIRGHIEKLAEQGIIIERKGKGTEKLYQLPPEEAESSEA